jgi:hypothetical protein
MASISAQEFVDIISDAAVHWHQILLYPPFWKAYQKTIDLVWQDFPFAASSKPKVPQKPGVYAFLLQPGVASLNSSVVMYIGKTDRPLRTRFAEYLREAESAAARPELRRMLHFYRGHLVFSCVPLDAPIKPSDVEDGLLSALTPPVNSSLPARVSRIVNAF